MWLLLGKRSVQQIERDAEWASEKSLDQRTPMEFGPQLSHGMPTDIWSIGLGAHAHQRNWLRTATTPSSFSRYVSATRATAATIAAALMSRVGSFSR